MSSWFYAIAFIIFVDVFMVNLGMLLDGLHFAYTLIAD